VNMGYSAHCMRPHTGRFFDALAAPSASSGSKEGGGQSGWRVASFDWAGSGYSQGVRCLYNGPDQVADLLQFVELVCYSWACVFQWIRRQEIFIEVVSMYSEKKTEFITRSMQVRSSRKLD